MKPSIAQGRIQARADFHAATKPIIDNATKKLKAAGPKVSRTARRADIKDDRQAELRIERQEAASLPALDEARATRQSKSNTAPTATPSTSGTTAQVVSLQAARAAFTASNQATLQALPDQASNKTKTSEASHASPSLAEKARLMREKMRNG
jgi:hypothetical protein